MTLEYNRRDITTELEMDSSVDNTRDTDLRSIVQSLTDLQQISSPAFFPGSSTLFSWPLQRKLEALVKCNMHDDQGPSVAMRSVLSVAERVVSDLTVHLQTQQHEKINIWTAIRSHGCQFLGPAMQEEVLKLILLALEDGSSLSRKVLVLFVVQRLRIQFPQASKTSVGHVVQLLYRASCFNVIKRDEESSLMQLKEEFRNYEDLRCQHDMQIVEISREFGLRIGPEQWSCLLYGDNKHRSHMQSIIDKLSKRQTLLRSTGDLIAILKKSGDPLELSTELQHLLDLLVDFQKNSSALKSTTVSLSHLDSCLKAVLKIVIAFARLLQLKRARKDDCSPALQNGNFETMGQSSGEIKVTDTAELDSFSPPINSYSKTYQEPLNESSSGNQNKFTQAVYPTSRFLNGLSTPDEASDLTTGLRSCNLGCMEAHCSSSSVISEDGHYPLPGYPSGVALSTHVSYPSCESLPFHVASQPPFFPPPTPINVMNSERVCTSLTGGGFCPSSVLLSIHNLHPRPSNVFQPMWYPAADVLLNTSSASDRIGN